MEKLIILSGEELVSRGTTKSDTALPEVGLKDVVPNGSWLEQKQVQSALEAKKHLIEVERIEKSGSLSHAEWHEELMLAEVTQKVGGHWQFMGHNVGKQLYLYPEEALFLIELNALQLTYNEVTVSLQQAYSLLLRSKVTILEYQVYSSLSRVGYKVFRHDGVKHKPEMALSENVSKINTKATSQDKSSKDTLNTKEESIKMEVDTKGTEIKTCDKNDVKVEGWFNNKCSEPEVSTSMESTKINTNVLLNDLAKRIEVDKVDSTSENYVDNHFEQVNGIEDATKDSISCTLKKLESRQIKPSNPTEVEKHFQTVPDMFQKHVVTVNVPQEEFIPKNVFLNNITYTLNLDGIRSRKQAETTSNEKSYLDEVNGSHIKRVGETSESPNVQNNWPQALLNTRPFGPLFRMFLPPFRPFGPNFFRPQVNMNMYQWNQFMNLARFAQLPRPPLLNPPNFGNYNINTGASSTKSETFNRAQPPTRKRARDSSKKTHMEAIKNLAHRLKNIIEAGNCDKGNIIALERLINTYNIRYRSKLRLTEEFEIFNNERIVDTIELDDDEATVSKKRKDSEDVTYDDNLNRIRKLAAYLKELEARNKDTPRHRRVLSALVKKFNKSYDADISLVNNKLVDKSLISLDSSSESDCVVEEPKKAPSGKKLKNPFSILKKLAEKQNSLPTNIPSTTTDVSHSTNSNQPTSGEEITGDITKIHNSLIEQANGVGKSDEGLKQFGNWMPPEDDFGKPEVPTKHTYNFILEHKRDEYIYDYIKNHPNDFGNWLELKIGFLKAFAHAQSRIASNNIKPPLEMDESNLKPIINPEDGADVPSVLKKLSIIKTYTEISDQTKLKIDFDVYNRDVQNFRKTNRPQPHFRVICVSESAPFPPGSDVAALHSSDDGVTILFAAVSVGSVSYLQVNPANLPIYVPTHE